MESVTVVGSGAGGMAVSAAIAETGRDVTICDHPDFPANIDAIAARGAVHRRLRDRDEVESIAVAGATTDIGAAVAGADLVVVVAPLLAHPVLLGAVGDAGPRLLFVGEGGGALRAVGAGRSPGSVAEFNTLPYLARLESPGQVMVRNKTGGLFLAAADPAATPGWMDFATAAWPWAAAAEDVFDTIIANYNVIDHVPTVLANAGYLEGGAGKWHLWGSGCTPSVARAIQALDDELQRLRLALGLPRREYADCLVAQGFVERRGEDLHATIHDSVIADVTIERGPAFLEFRFITEDVPHGLVLIESIGRAYGVDLPVVGALITFTSMLLGRDTRAGGTTLATLGLPETGAELDEVLNRQ